MCHMQSRTPLACERLVLEPRMCITNGRGTGACAGGRFGRVQSYEFTGEWTRTWTGREKKCSFAKTDGRGLKWPRLVYECLLFSVPFFRVCIFILYVSLFGSCAINHADRHSRAVHHGDANVSCNIPHASCSQITYLQYAPFAQLTV